MSAATTQLRRIAAVVWSERRLYLTGSVFVAVSIGTALAYPQVIRLIIDDAIAGGQTRRLNQLAAIMVGVLLVEAVSTCVRDYCFNLGAERVAAALRRLVFGPFTVSDHLSLSDRSVRGFLLGPPLHSDVWSAARALAADDPRRDLHRVTCPVLCLWGARDRQVPIDDAIEYARRLRAPLRTIADCGHVLIGERPEACADAIERFLA